MDECKDRNLIDKNAEHHQLWFKKKAITKKLYKKLKKKDFKNYEKYNVVFHEIHLLT